MDHPLSLVSALIFRQKGKKIQIPWFIFWFVVAMLVNTYCNLPTQLTHGISVAARCGLSATLFLIGGGLSIEVIRKVGLAAGAGHHPLGRHLGRIARRDLALVGSIRSP